MRKLSLAAETRDSSVPREWVLLVLLVQHGSVCRERENDPWWAEEASRGSWRG